MRGTPKPRTRPSSRSARIGVALVVAGSLACSATPASAADTATAESGAHRGSADHTAGSQIALHEGVGGTPRFDSAAAPSGVPGHDVSKWQGEVDWNAARSSGARFVYVKATEGVGYTSPTFGQQYDGAYGADMVRGAYHFALPDSSSGAAQANYFVDNGGGWSDDGRTLPGALDLEYNPYGDDCYGKSAADMAGWIKDFSDTYRARTGRFPTIYTSTTWWQSCTGNNGGFGANPLWLARYSDSIGALPSGWGSDTIWQYADSGRYPGDQNRYNGDLQGLTELARG